MQVAFSTKAIQEYTIKQPPAPVASKISIDVNLDCINEKSNHLVAFLVAKAGIEPATFGL